MRRAGRGRAAPAAVLVVALGAGLGLAAGAAEAINKWIGIGDSIMTGSTWPCEGNNPEDPPICPAVFDCSGDCAVSPTPKRDQCGIVRRLDVFLGGGAANYVRNEGVGGQRTGEALTRFPLEMDENCPGSPGECIAIILMHGTNDMFATISPETATANLQAIITQAKARNIDVLLMTVIRKINQPTNTKWSSYRNLVLALAASENVPSVDPWTPLCPDAACYNANYWVAGSCGGPGEFDVGHPDPDGYNVMGNLVTAAFPATVPGIPATTSPAGDILDTTPDFVWPELAGARWYALEVDAGTATWWEAAEHCAAGTCTANPGVALAKGAHSWRVRGRNLRGLSTWSAATAFEIWGVPGATAPSDPQGTFYDATPLVAPFGWEPFEWSAATEATDYDLVVKNGGGVVYMDSFTSSACAGSTCSGSPGQGLADGAYTWTVQARNPATSGPVSAPLAFEIVSSAPGAVTPTAPTGEFFAPLAPLYTWLPAPKATEYDLEVKDSQGIPRAGVNGLQASTACVGAQCSVQGGSLTIPEVYTLKLRGRNQIGDGPWSSPGAVFTLLACSDPSAKNLAQLEPSPVTTTKTVKYCGPVSAAMTAPYTIESTGDLTLHTGGGFTAYDGFTVAGALTVKSP